jgi:hypothetical protein
VPNVGCDGSVVIIGGRWYEGLTPFRVTGSGVGAGAVTYGTGIASVDNLTVDGHPGIGAWGYTGENTGSQTVARRFYYMVYKAGDAGNPSRFMEVDVTADGSSLSLGKVSAAVPSEDANPHAGWIGSSTRWGDIVDADGVAVYAVGNWFYAPEPMGFYFSDEVFTSTDPFSQYVGASTGDIVGDLLEVQLAVSAGIIYAGLNYYDTGVGAAHVGYILPVFSKYGWGVPIG